MSRDVSGKKKVLHIINGFGPGGVETWLLSAVKFLYHHPGYNLQFDFLLTGGVQQLFDEEIRKHGSRTFYHRYSLGRAVPFKRQFIQVLKENKYIAVHDHEDFVSGWHYLLGGNYLPSVRISHLHNPYNFVHNYVVNPLRWVSFKAGRWSMARKATAITGTSNAVMDEYGYDKTPFVEKRVSPAYCGFDTNRFQFDASARSAIVAEFGWNEESRIALFVGRIGLQDYDTAANQKNPAFAFDIAKQLVTSYPEWRFLFVGYKGATGSLMEQEVKEKGLSTRIRFMDVRGDIPRIMSASDVLVFPSLWEGLGMVAVEAQCTGIRVIMSDAVPAEAIVCPEIVTVKDLGSGIDSWVDAIVGISESRVDRQKFASRIDESPFSIENSVSRLISLYEG